MVPPPPPEHEPEPEPELRLHGRASSTARVAVALDRVAEGVGGSVLVVGPPGSGRTALLDDAVRRADPTLRVVRVHGAPAEQAWGLALVAELAHRLRGVRPLRPGSLDRVLDAVAGGEPAASPGPVAAALTALLAAAAADRPLVLVVDDVDALDEDSRAVLATAVRRLADDPVLVVLAGDPSVAAQLPGVAVEELAPLDAAAAAALLLDAARRPVAPAVRDRLVELADGRPAVLVELARALTDDQLAGRAPLSDPLPVGPLLVKGALVPFEGLSAEELWPSRLLAVAGELPVASLADASGSTTWAAQAEAAGTVVVEGGRVRLVDRIAAAALVHELDSSERRRAHAEVATLLDPSDPMRTWHRAAASATADEEVAVALAAEAERARGRGALVTSAAWWERAAELSRDPGRRAVRLLAAAAAHLDAGHPAPVDPLLVEVVAARAAMGTGPASSQVDAGVAHLEALLALRTGAVDEAMGPLRRASARLAEARPVAGAAALLDVVPSVLRAARPDRAAELLREADRLLREPGARSESEGWERESARLRLAEAALAVARRGPDAETELVEVTADVVASDASALAFVAECAGLALIWAERYERATVLLDGLERRARAAAAPAPLATVRALQALGAMRRGHLRDAAVAAAEAVGASDEPAAAGLAPFALSVLAVVEAQRGDVEGCRDAADRLLHHAAISGDRRWEVPARAAVGLLALGVGRPEDAVHELLPLLSSPVSAPWVVMWQGDLVEAMVRSGRRDEASEVLAALDERGTWSSGRAGALRERLDGVLAADPEVALVHFRSAAARSAAAGAELGRARARLAEGQTLRRLRRRSEARVALDDARLAFSAMGAEPWAHVAEVERAACGASAEGPRPDPPTSAAVLTPQELQVARLVAGGSTNREVADRLFVSVRTVESHLGRVYRKLGVRSRSALAARADVLRDGPAGP